MFIPLLVSAAVMAAEPQPVTQSGTAARVSIEKQQPATGYNLTGWGGDGDVMALVQIVLMESAKSAREDLKDIMEGVKRLNKEKAEARELLLAMKQEQQRLKNDGALRRDQREWANSLSRLCPPGTQQDDCLLQQLRLRTAVLKETPARP